MVDARDEFADDYLVPALQANALYEGKYPLVSALSRPVIVKHLVDAAREYGADAVAHGCTGKGNDQVRFEVSARALAPDLEVLAPVRVWGITRDDSHRLRRRSTTSRSASPRRSSYSIDENLWGRAIECGDDRGPVGVAAARRPYALTPTPADAPTEPREVVIGFEQGVPVALDGEAHAAARARSIELGDDRRRVRLGPPRHGREPPGRHQEPRDLRVPGRRWR